MSGSDSFRVPASTSNLGAGFDALSLALQRYLKISLQAGDKSEIAARGVSAELIPTTPDNLIVRVAASVAKQRHRQLPAFRMTIDNEIPLARGMGSSAAAIIAGITCYELLTEDKLSEQEIFRYAFEFEPHPDNLAAALRGGLVAAAVAADGDVLIAKLTVPEGIRPIVVIPAFELSTEKARAVLPQSYSRKDAVYNIQRSALTIAALTTGDWAMLREAMRDRIHQPYRAPLIPGLEEILDLETPGLIAVALSGAGPTVLALAKPADAENVGRAIAGVFERHGVKASPHLVNIDNEGRVIV
ncbi:MAG: homoserine kinase [Acidobacteria bacterium 13_1_40CM_2_56_5]|nr:MAG: homoserine kinase [Acidobacteria bacterium 13_1_40CM_2_56_5]